MIAPVKTLSEILHDLCVPRWALTYLCLEPGGFVSHLPLDVGVPDDCAFASGDVSMLTAALAAGCLGTDDLVVVDTRYDGRFHLLAEMEHATARPAELIEYVDPRDPARSRVETPAGGDLEGLYSFKDGRRVWMRELPERLGHLTAAAVELTALANAAFFNRLFSFAEGNTWQTTYGEVSDIVSRLTGGRADLRTATTLFPDRSFNLSSAFVPCNLTGVSMLFGTMTFADGTNQGVHEARGRSQTIRDASDLLSYVVEADFAGGRRRLSDEASILAGSLGKLGRWTMGKDTFQSAIDDLTGFAEDIDIAGALDAYHMGVPISDIFA